MKDPTFSPPRGGGDWETPDHYIIFATGEKVSQKPEGMTHLYQNVLVPKDHPRIILRGLLDSFQAHLVDAQLYFRQLNISEELVNDIDELLHFSRIILGCEVLNTPIPDINILGMTMDEIQDRSHYPDNYYGMKQMVLINKDCPPSSVRFNLLRALSREIELHAVKTFDKDNKRNDIIKALNRLSSALHLLMYKAISQNL